MEPKLWYSSKTIWVNGLALIGAILQAKFGWIIPAEFYTYGLLALNLILRKVTKQPIIWSNP